ncbi:MAG: glycosyltransferase N-terminal domain-containing protein, partial [Rikenellaceae bacterium]
PVIELFRESHPDYLILLTFYSPSGYELRKDYAHADYIYYLPLDTRKNAKRFLGIVSPEVAVFVKYDFWKNFLTELKNRDINCYVISAIFRPTQLFFKSYGASYAALLRNFTHLFVQNKESQQLLHSIGIDRVTVCGDTRFDRVMSIANSAKELELFKQFSEGSEVFITGSSWEKDDEITLGLIENFKKVKFIIAPHELCEAKIAKLYSDIEQLGRKVVRYTQIDDVQKAAECEVIIIDTIGILSKVYRNADYAYIGGGFGVGIHNTLEAATFGIPMIFGPNYQRFAEAVSLVELGVATPIDDANGAQRWLFDMQNNPAKRENLNQICKSFVEDNVGACQKIINHPLV